jgi:hypothetical protein
MLVGKGNNPVTNTKRYRFKNSKFSQEEVYENPFL